MRWTVDFRKRKGQRSGTEEVGIREKGIAEEDDKDWYKKEEKNKEEQDYITDIKKCLSQSLMG